MDSSFYLNGAGRAHEIGEWLEFFNGDVLIHKDDPNRKELLKQQASVLAAGKGAMAKRGAVG